MRRTAAKGPPLILISPSTAKREIEFGDYSLDLSMNYVLAVKAAAGTPRVVPCLPDRDFIADAVKRCDGVMLTGGGDVQPRLYRKELPAVLEKTVELAAPERDLFEIMLIDEVFRQQKPLLAICRGQQILNVALGGSLFIDIAAEVPQAMNHSRSDRKNEIVHEVKTEVGSVLAQIARKTWLGVNSSHHQAVAKIAKPLRPTAVSIDGIIEGLELNPGSGNLLPYLMAVQFHPERLFARHAEHLELFKHFIAACSRHRRNPYEA